MRKLPIFLILLIPFFTASLECKILELEVSPNEEVTLPLFIKNDENKEKTVQLSYHPEYIEGAFYYSGKKVSSLKMNSGESLSLDFVFKAPSKEGMHFLSIYAEEAVSILLKVKYPKDPIKIYSPISEFVSEAGEQLSFYLNLRSNVNSVYEVEMRCLTPEKWECRFFDGNTEVKKIRLSAMESRSLIVKIDIDSSTVVGVHKVLLKFNEFAEEISVFVEKSYAGERGKLKLSLVDREGKGVASAKISTENYTFFTSADGSAIFELPQGTYELKIEKEGYYEKNVRDVKIKGGKTTDLGTIFLEKKPFSAEIILSSTRVSATIGKTTQISLKLKNLGYTDDSYSLRVENLPENFVANFKEGNIAISEIFVESGDTKQLKLEIYIPPTAEPKDVPIRIVAEGMSMATADLTLVVIGELRFYFEPEGGMYTFQTTQGEILRIKGYIRNVGYGFKLTNVKVIAEIPESWSLKVEPEVIPSIDPGSFKEVTLTITVPPNTNPSEYRLTVKVVTDQGEIADRLSVVVKSGGFGSFIGLGIVILAIFLLFFLIKKMGRR